MRTPVASMLFFLAAALIGAVGQFLYQSGTRQAAGSLASYLLNGRILGGVVCYVAVMALFVAAFRKGGSLTVLYPLYASTFVWAALIAWATHGEAIKPVNVLGMVCLVVGMALMGR